MLGNGWGMWDLFFLQDQGVWQLEIICEPLNCAELILQVLHYRKYWYITDDALEKTGTWSFTNYYEFGKFRVWLTPRVVLIAISGLNEKWEVVWEMLAYLKQITGGQEGRPCPGRGRYRK